MVDYRPPGTFASATCAGRPVVEEFAGPKSIGSVRRRVGSIRRRIRAKTDRARATRKPRLLFRLSGVFLLRFVDRQFAGVLFQLPPRITRLEPLDLPPTPFLSPFGGSAKPIPPEFG